MLINDSGKSSRIISRGNQATKFSNNLLNNYIEVVKINENFVGDISKRSATSSFNSHNRNRINVKRNSPWGFNEAGTFFLPVLFKICFCPFQYVICGIHVLINVKIVLNKATDAIPV